MHPGLSSSLVAALRETAANSRWTHPPVDDRDLARVELALGRRLPAPLRDLYRLVGDGGFGPGGGLWGVGSQAYRLAGRTLPHRPDNLGPIRL